MDLTFFSDGFDSLIFFYFVMLMGLTTPVSRRSPAHPDHRPGREGGRPYPLASTAAGEAAEPPHCTRDRKNRLCRRERDRVRVRVKVRVRVSSFGCA